MSETSEVPVMVEFAKKHPILCTQYDVIKSGADAALEESEKSSFKKTSSFEFYLDLAKTAHDDLRKNRIQGNYDKYLDKERLFNYEKSMESIVETFMMKAQEHNIDLSECDAGSEQSIRKIRKKLKTLRTERLLRKRQKENDVAAPKE